MATRLAVFLLVATSAIVATCAEDAVALLQVSPLSRFCTGKRRGAYCFGAQVIQCYNGFVLMSERCGMPSTPAQYREVCIQKTVGSYFNAQCGLAPELPTDFCAGKSQGAYCYGQTLATCSGNAIYKTETCQGQELCIQDTTGSYYNAHCGRTPSTGTFCTGKSQGAYCYGMNLIHCDGGSIFKSQRCGDPNAPVQHSSVCIQGTIGTYFNAQCGAPPAVEADFCRGKSQGAYCYGRNLVTCSGDEIHKADLCPDEQVCIQDTIGSYYNAHCGAPALAG